VWGLANKRFAGLPKAPALNRNWECGGRLTFLLKNQMRNETEIKLICTRCDSIQFNFYEIDQNGKVKNCSDCPDVHTWAMKDLKSYCSTCFIEGAHPFAGVICKGRQH
jgi:hypothetical protein